jgi:FixJ family two-component response regulator
MKPILCVIDDENEILNTYREFFEDQYQVFVFNSPMKFIEALDTQEVLPDAAITDFKMPELTGIQMIQMVRERELDFPILLLSGHIEKDVALDAIELGTFSILEKPISFDKLKLVVERMMYEVELDRLRSEIRHIMLQIKEIYEGVREAILPHVPEDVLNRFFIEAEDGVVKRKLGLEQVLVELDRKLDLLLKAEKSLLEIRRRSTEGH